MNSDTLFTIAQFAGPKQAMQITREYAVKFFPKSITIVGHKQLEEFYGWAHHLDTRNLTEVRIVIHDYKLVESLRTDFPNAVRADGLVLASPIGLVPPSVKKLTLSVWTDEQVQISETVEELIIEEVGAGCRGIALPNSVRSLHLMDGFSGVVYQWPENLERLCMNGWSDGGNGRWPVPIDGLPDTIKHMTLGAHLDVEILHWPESLETLVIEGNPQAHGWGIEDLDLPDEVEIIVKREDDEAEHDDDQMDENLDM